MNTAQTTNEPEISMEELEALMSGFDMEDIIEEKEPEEMSEAEILSLTFVGEEVLEEVVEEDFEEEPAEIEESVLASAMRAINAKEMAEEIYAEQVSTDDHVDKVEHVEAVVGTVATKAVKVTKAASTPRKTTFTHSKAELIADRANPNFYLLEKADLLLDADGQKAKRDEVIKLIYGMNVKGTAKCINLLSALNGKTKLSTFIDSGVRYIFGENAMTKSDLEAYFMSAARNKVKAYNKSTALPQSLALLKLFTDLKLIVKVGAVYEINQNSLLIEALSTTYKGA